MIEPTERDREMARKAWAGITGFPKDRCEVIAQIIAAARVEERERCAKIASERDVRHDGHYDAPLSVYDRGYLKACQEISAKIRSGE